MHRSISEVSTDSPSVNLKKLCRHFSHKIEVSFDDECGDIKFPFGRGLLEATDGQLRITAEADDMEALAKTEQVLADHLVRFGSKETLVVQWHRQA
ncbi:MULTISPECIES: DUF2218 domain-containing protein [Pseudomonas]|uniref:DUF2218 domain-containing protein n=1 Tax=Pseudomonas TaxID=286 RepID=UPI00123B5664|nr:MULTISPECIES: DUF2218 domain-containing protein [Pseudomonas]QIB49983.1 DUF2218 domain-containing protein [Pseudomonas sp. OIL-1]